jgi:hypothetical protein
MKVVEEALRTVVPNRRIGEKTFYIQREIEFIDRYGGKKTGSSIGWRC